MVYYFVLKQDLKVHHKKALTRCVLLAIVAGLVKFFLGGVRFEGFKEGNDNKKKKYNNKCGTNTTETDCSGYTDVSCSWDVSNNLCYYQ